MPNVVINGEDNVVENGVDGKGEGRVQGVVYLNKLMICLLFHSICLVFIGVQPKI